MEKRTPVCVKYELILDFVIIYNPNLMQYE